MNSYHVIRFGGRRTRAVALVLVLSFLVIISGLIIAFFSMVTTEASSAGTNAAAASAKSLADSAVSFVMGTIVDATQGHDPENKDKNAPGGPANAWAWASQPGMIRTYDTSGTARYVYKLYSADTMKQLPTGDGSTETAGLSGWATGANKAVWVDMNEPVKSPSVTDPRSGAPLDIYPIVDPSADESYGTLVQKYPGRTDPYTDHRVEGFKVLDANSDPNAPMRDPNNNNPAPMPVKWLYVLQDGTLTTATASGANATLNSKLATADNPIKGRIAFWTDDESSKVNINTASEGTYWDTPRIYSHQDVGSVTNYTPGGQNPLFPVAATGGLALTQPAKGEYQRYPGHPATTSLSPVFGYLGTNAGLKPVMPLPVVNPNSTLTHDAETKTYEYYYNMTPRIVPGGSYGGTTVATG